MGAIVDQFADFAEKTNFSDLPEPVVHEMKRVVLDSIGCSLLGQLTSKGRIAADLAGRLGGPRESTVIGRPDMVSCVNAAFANGESINALDFDAISHVGRHDVPFVVSGLLASSESAGVSGSDFILGTAMAFEISGRVKAAAGSFTTTGSKSGKIPWPEVSAVAEGAPLGVAAGSGKIMGLDREKIANAIGIAGYICAPPTMRKFMDTAPARMTKYSPAGWGAQAGVTAALLAKMDYIGDTDLFEGDHGFYRYMGKNQGEVDADMLVRSLNSLGKDWSANKISYKQYPSGY